MKPDVAIRSRLNTRAGRLRAARLFAGIVEFEGRRLAQLQHSRNFAAAFGRKAPDDIVTELDILTEKRLLRALRKLQITDRALGEESGLSGAPDRYTWVVDPIDGSTNFAHGMNVFAVSVALMDHTNPIAAACFDARDLDIYYAAAGGGAWRRRGTAGAGPARAASKLHIIASRSAAFDRLDMVGVQWSPQTAGMPPALAAAISLNCKIRVLGSAVAHWLSVASGACAAGILQRVKIWDIAAAGLIASEAGAALFHFDGKPLLPFADDAFDHFSRDLPSVSCHPLLKRVLLHSIREAGIR